MVGFLVFRGANWYWYFHWNHHRYTNDPLRDPELSGSTVDRADPTLTQGVISKLSAYGGEQQIGGSGGSLEPPGPLLDPLGLFLRTSIPFVWRILSAFLRA